MGKIAVALVITLFLQGCSEDLVPIVRGVNYVGASVADIDRSSQFYANAANLELVKDGSLHSDSAIDALVARSDARATTRMMKSANAQIRFMQFDAAPSGSASVAMSPVDVQGPGIAHVCYQVNKTTKAYDRFLAAGASTIGDPAMVQLNPRRPVDYAYARDLDGIMFEVEHVDVSQLDLPEPPKYDYRIRHVSLATPDIDRLVDFYSVLLAESKPRRIGRFGGFSGENVDKVSGLPESKLKMAWFQIRNLELEIVQYVSHPTEVPTEPRPIDALGYNMIVFDVIDLAMARERLLAAGGSEVVTEAVMDGGKILFGRDPDGNLLGFQTVADDSVYSSQNFKDNGI